MLWCEGGKGKHPQRLKDGHCRGLIIGGKGDSSLGAGIGESNQVQGLCESGLAGGSGESWLGKVLDDGWFHGGSYLGGETGWTTNREHIDGIQEGIERQVVLILPESESGVQAVDFGARVAGQRAVRGSRMVVSGRKVHVVEVPVPGRVGEKCTTEGLLPSCQTICDAILHGEPYRSIHDRLGRVVALVACARGTARRDDRRVGLEGKENRKRTGASEGCGEDGATESRRWPHARFCNWTALAVDHLFLRTSCEKSAHSSDINCTCNLLPPSSYFFPLFF